MSKIGSKKRVLVEDELEDEDSDVLTDDDDDDVIDINADMEKEINKYIKRRKQRSPNAYKVRKRVLNKNDGSIAKETEVLFRETYGKLKKGKCYRRRKLSMVLKCRGPRITSMMKIDKKDLPDETLLLVTKIREVWKLLHQKYLLTACFIFVKGDLLMQKRI